MEAGKGKVNRDTICKVCTLAERVKEAVQIRDTENSLRDQETHVDLRVE